MTGLQAAERRRTNPELTAWSDTPAVRALLAQVSDATVSEFREMGELPRFYGEPARLLKLQHRKAWEIVLASDEPNATADALGVDTRPEALIDAALTASRLVEVERISETQVMA